MIFVAYFSLLVLLVLVLSIPQFSYSKHAIYRMKKRNISESDIKTVIINGKRNNIISAPNRTAIDYTVNNRKLRVVHDDYFNIITVMEVYS